MITTLTKDIIKNILKMEGANLERVYPGGVSVGVIVDFSKGGKNGSFRIKEEDFIKPVSVIHEIAKHAIERPVRELERKKRACNLYVR